MCYHFLSLIQDMGSCTKGGSRSNAVAWGRLDPIPLCFRGPRLFSDIYHTVKSDLVLVQEAPSLLNLSVDGERKKGQLQTTKKEPQSIWLLLQRAACVFHLATGILRRRTAALPEPHTQALMMSLRFNHYRLQKMLCWAGLVPTLVYANSTLEAIMQSGSWLTLM